MGKTFQPWKIDQTQLPPPAVSDYVPDDHLSHFVVALVRESLDHLAEIIGVYKSALGQPPFDPRPMTALLLYAYCSGLYSSRRIAKACAERVDFMMIVAHDAPDFRAIADFRKRHLAALAKLFLQVLKLAEKAGLTKLGQVALDGTKIKANASRHKAMSYERMKTREAELQAEIDSWLEAAEAADAQEDKLHGATRRGDEMPTGSTINRNDWPKSERPNKRWKQRPPPPRLRRPRPSARPRRSARPRTASARGAVRVRLRVNPIPRRNAISPIPTVACSWPRTASSRATTPRRQSMAAARSLWRAG